MADEYWDLYVQGVAKNTQVDDTTAQLILKKIKEKEHVVRFTDLQGRPWVVTIAAIAGMAKYQDR